MQKPDLLKKLGSTTVKLRTLPVARGHFSSIVLLFFPVLTPIFHFIFILRLSNIFSPIWNGSFTKETCGPLLHANWYFCVARN
jgi:hypothetical protein